MLRSNPWAETGVIVRGWPLCWDGSEGDWNTRGCQGFLERIKSLSSLMPLKLQWTNKSSGGFFKNADGGPEVLVSSQLRPMLEVWGPHFE